MGTAKAGGDFVVSFGGIAQVVVKDGMVDQGIDHGNGSERANSRKASGTQSPSLVIA